ncbi:sigma-70 family RNA polymerase sigma factor [bacterium]|nr:sigma-70 family RNA polymerase sigma factor [bacterium]
MTTEEPDSASSLPRRDGLFVTTRWTAVLQAGRKSSPDSDRALADLCRTYWYPLYAFVRRRCQSREDAEDLTQGFFEKFLSKNYLEGLNAERGKFRAFLLASLKHFLANEWDKTGRQKRGGGAQVLSLNWQSADERFHIDPPDHASPDRLFDREWAITLLEQVVERLRTECVADGRAELFEQSRGYLMLGEAAIPYADAAEKLGLEEGAVRVAVHRLRKRYRQLLRDEIAQTINDPAQVQEELRSLQAALVGQ